MICIPELLIKERRGKEFVLRMVDVSNCNFEVVG